MCPRTTDIDAYLHGQFAADVCFLITTATYVTSLLLLYMCPHTTDIDAYLHGQFATGARVAVGESWKCPRGH